MIPGVPDCDFNRGEPPLTRKQVAEFANSYTDYQFIDSEHELERNGRKIGKPSASFLLDEDSTFRVKDGVKSYPKGTWMLTAHLTDQEAIETALNGGYTGASPTVKNRKVADRYKAALKSQTMTYPEMISACKSYSQGELIKDVVDPVVLSVSLTGKPCQEHSKFCKYKIGDKMTNSNEVDVKTKVLAALGMTNEAEVTALKSQVETLDEKIDGLEEEFKSSLKSMQDSFEETLTNALKEVGSGASKSQNPKDDDEDGEGTEPTNEEGNEDAGNPEPTNEDDDDDEPEPPKKKTRGASKSQPIHNNSSDGDRFEKDTYTFMGRRPDGTAKSI